MTHQRDLDGALRDYLAEGTNELADRVIAGALEQIDLTEQRRASRVPWRFPPMFRTLRALGAVALVAVLVIGGAYLVQRGLTDVGNASPSPEASATTSPPPIVTLPTPSPTAEVLSLDLTWTELDLEANLESGIGGVAWLNDRFVLLEDSGAIRTSTDGAIWRVHEPGDPDPGYAELLKGEIVTWEDTIVGWWNPEDGGGGVANQPPITARDILRIVRPPAAPVDSSPFKGRIESIGIGPAGIVAQVHSHIDTDAFIASRLGENWVSHYTGVDFRDGILDVGMDNGPGLHVVWADEGFELGDYFDAGFGWYSPDGVEWTAMPTIGTPGSDEFRGIPTGFGEVVGVSDGFIARGIDTECASDNGCAGMWYSADGLSWQNIGNAPNGASGTYGSLVPWMGGALVLDGVGRFDLWTSDGATELPLVAELPDAWTQSDLFDASFDMGPLGMATVLKNGQQILVSWDGVGWDIQPMPAAMAAGSTLVYALPTVVVGDRSVLVVVWSGSREARIPTFWVGTPTP